MTWSWPMSSMVLEYLKNVVTHHVSGQMKIAPEHSDPHVLELMGKPGQKSLSEFRRLFFELSQESRQAPISDVLPDSRTPWLQ